jgi:DNA repair exonuclease SbcCD nuclease subunit
MIRQTKHRGSVSAILCSDIHLREDKPICRTDDYWNAQWKKMDYIGYLQGKYDCPVLCGGDLFNHWKPSPMLLSETIKHIPKQFFTVYGQHDLPQHNLDLAYKSGIFTLWMGGHIELLAQGHWGQEIDINKSSITLEKIPILVLHITTYVGSLPFEATPASKILKDYPQYKLILTGDNHQPFVTRIQDSYVNGVEKFRLLVNPGSMMRMTADQINHDPRVYLWYAESNTVEPIYLPIEEDVISREHIDIQQKRDARIDAFISSLDGDWKATMSFEDNLQVFEKKNNVEKEVMNIIYKSLENEKSQI